MKSTVDQIIEMKQQFLKNNTEVSELLDERIKERKLKNYSRTDEIRQYLLKKYNIIIEDSYLTQYWRFQ